MASQTPGDGARSKCRTLRFFSLYELCCQWHPCFTNNSIYDVCLSSLLQVQKYEDVPAWVLSQAKEKMGYLQETLGFLKEMFLTRPIQWLVSVMHDGIVKACFATSLTLCCITVLSSGLFTFWTRLQSNPSLWIDAVCLLVHPSVNILINLVNIYAKVLKLALQSGHTVFIGFMCLHEDVMCSVCACFVLACRFPLLRNPSPIWSDSNVCW